MLDFRLFISSPRWWRVFFGRWLHFTDYLSLSRVNFGLLSCTFVAPLIFCPSHLCVPLFFKARCFSFLAAFFRTTETTIFCWHWYPLFFLPWIFRLFKWLNPNCCSNQTVAVFTTLILKLFLCPGMFLQSLFIHCRTYRFNNPAHKVVLVHVPNRVLVSVAVSGVLPNSRRPMRRLSSPASYFQASLFV